MHPQLKRTSRAPARRWVALSLLVSLASASAGVSAQVADKAAAEALFDEGKRLLEAGNAAEACPKFEASHKRDPGIGTLLFLGECYERTQRVASAWAAFREAASMAKQAGDNRESVARSRAEALDAKLYRVGVVAQKPVKGIKIAVDGRVLSQEELGVPIPLDPGPHEVVAEAPGFIAVRRSFEVPSMKGSETLTLPELAPDGSAPPPIAPTATPTAAPPPTAQPVAEPPGKGLLISGIVVGGVGVAGLVATGVLAGVASSKDGEADEICSETACRSQRGEDLSSEAQTLGNVATGTFIGGLVLAGAGLTLILLQPSSDSSSAGAGLRVGAGSVHLQGSF